MFVDLSGFTPLMDVLAREGSRGAEQMSVILNDIFAPLVRLVYTKGGFIPYFAGDAFIAVFPESNPEVNAREALFAALQARNMFSQRAFRFGEFTIGIKIGLAYGDVEWGIVGDQHKSFYFRGNSIGPVHRLPDSRPEPGHHARCILAQTSRPLHWCLWKK